MAGSLAGGGAGGSGGSGRRREWRCWTKWMARSDLKVPRVSVYIAASRGCETVHLMLGRLVLPGARALLSVTGLAVPPRRVAGGPAVRPAVRCRLSCRPTRFIHSCLAGALTRGKIYRPCGKQQRHSWKRLRAVRVVPFTFGAGGACLECRARSGNKPRDP